MDCVIVAGGLPDPEDPIYTLTEGRPKALLDMGGRTMLERVVDALQGVPEIETVVVVGLGSDLGMTFQRPVHHLPDEGGLISNVLAGINWLRRQKPGVESVLLSSADIPLITTDIVSDFLDRCRPFDKAIYYNFVSQETLERRFPHSNRTFVKLRDGQFAGGDMLIVRTFLADSHRELWEALTNARKHAWKLARIIGLRFLFKFLIHRLSLADIEKTANRIVDHPNQIIVNQHAEIAMDADKPHQIEMLRAELANA